jgi:putative ABC transport system ATP-binding protein
MLEAVDITKEYRRGDTLFRAVERVSLSVGKGEFLGIVGRSGSGKSTFLNILTGLLPPTSGRISFAGREYAALSDAELSGLRGSRIGYIMQGHSLLRNFTVLQNVLLPSALMRLAGNPVKKALGLLSDLGLRHLARQYPSSLSGGEMRRVAIARALIASPEVLLADEPTNDLDESTADDILRLFSSISRNGTAVLMVTHDPTAAARCDRVYAMENGRLAAV